VHIGFWEGTLRERDHLEYQGDDGTIILKCIFNKVDGGGMDWIDLVHDRDSWRALANVLMNLRIP